MGEAKALALHHRLRADLEAGVFGPGDRLSENELAGRYGVSRTPVREALVRLEMAGLVAREGGMVTVPSPSHDEILDLFDTRIVLEVAITHDAAKRRRDSDVALLRAAAARCRTLDADAQPARVYEANRAFHHALADASRNRVIAGLQRQLDLRVATLRMTTLTAPGRWATALEQHDAIAEAVAARNAPAAAAAARAHLQDARELWLQTLVHASDHHSSTETSPWTS